MKKNKNFITYIFDIIIALAIVATFTFGYKYSLEVHSGEYSTTQKLTEVDNVIKEGISREDLENTPGYGIYKLKVKNVTDWMPVVEGDDLEFLAGGIGHNTATGHPGDNRQIFLSAHRDTHFKELEFVNIGDTVIVQTSYGKFEYTVSHTKIVDATEVSVIKTEQLEEDELVLMTCWPFNSWTDSTERYLIYAYPKK
ncbi:MAG: class D sortase [Bacilli bacterium]